MTNKIDGISILVGTAACNANCSECAGRQHKKNAPKRDGELDEARLREVLEYCYARQCRYVTLTGCGEPTLSPGSVTRTLEIMQGYREEGRVFEPVNLYTNGIRIGFDEEFCGAYLPLWRSLGLTSVYVSVYSGDEELSRQAFRVARYPDFRVVFSRIKERGLRLRTSVILKQGFVDTAEKLEALCEKFFQLGVYNVSAWPLKDEDGSISDLAPDQPELARMRAFVEKCPELNIRLLLGDSNSSKKQGKKMALFQDGEISDVWCARK